MSTDKIYAASSDEDALAKREDAETALIESVRDSLDEDTKMALENAEKSFSDALNDTFSSESFIEKETSFIQILSGVLAANVFEGQLFTENDEVKKVVRALSENYFTGKTFNSSEVLRPLKSHTGDPFCFSASSPVDDRYYLSARNERVFNRLCETARKGGSVPYDQRTRMLGLFNKALSDYLFDLSTTYEDLVFWANDLRKIRAKIKKDLCADQKDLASASSDPDESALSGVGRAAQKSKALLKRVASWCVLVLISAAYCAVLSFIVDVFYSFFSDFSGKPTFTSALVLLFASVFIAFAVVWLKKRFIAAIAGVCETVCLSRGGARYITIGALIILGSVFEAVIGYIPHGVLTALFGGALITVGAKGLYKTSRQKVNALKSAVIAILIIVLRFCLKALLTELIQISKNVQ